MDIRHITCVIGYSTYDNSTLDFHHPILDFDIYHSTFTSGTGPSTNDVWYLIVNIRNLVLDIQHTQFDINIRHWTFDIDIFIIQQLAFNPRHWIFNHSRNNIRNGTFSILNSTVNIQHTTFDFVHLIYGLRHSTFGIRYLTFVIHIMTFEIEHMRH